ncbi:hypothetical protein O7632_27850 [Solwaraspora sp. WMMD406]|uniref:hypothetical protein n=1 Tax=Solwaraspora sp. WMMD406 TaxID=3016095 RepID=UPI002417146E|nr:hypothetical protein [Solwaraspora sp. WMMD406]MDG4767879.1 hypothetical protein [Solwaraspora sp. WMMD406]
MDDGPVSDRDIADAAATVLRQHAAGRPCHLGCAGDECQRLAWAHRRRAAAAVRRQRSI